MIKANDDCKPVIWQPLAGSQSLAVSCPSNVLLYEGSRGPGKTDAQLMAFRSRVGKGYGKFWRGIILDRRYKNLDDLIAKSERWFPQFRDGARFLRGKGDYKWIWPSGEELLFRQLERDSDYWNFHGQEFPWIGWNELTKFATPKPYDLMLSCNRSGFLPEMHTPKNPDGSYHTADGKPLPELPLQVFITTNPLGPGHAWVKKRFIDTAKPGEILKDVTNIFNPRSQKREDVTRTQTRLFGSYRENKFLAPEYIAGLESITDPNRRKAWLEGCWDIISGGMFDDLWKEQIHIIPNLIIPKSWEVDRSFDWGSSHPFSVGFWAEANGEAAKFADGSGEFCPTPGSLIRFSEWYGSAAIGTNEGLRMSGPEIAEGILEREMKLLTSGIICKIPEPGPADGQIYAKREKDVASIASKMSANGVDWVAADKSPGSRINGWQLVRDALSNAVRGEGPGLFFTEACKSAKALLPITPRDEDKPDDVDTTSEDHLQDEIRYRLLKNADRFAKNIPTSFPT